MRAGSSLKSVQVQEQKKGVPRVYWLILVVALLVGAVLGYSSTALVGGQTTNQKSQRLINSLETLNGELEDKLSSGTFTNSTLGLDPVAIYAATSASVVTVQGVQIYATGNASILGSGFVTTFQGGDYIVTNFHVVQNVTQLTVTFSDGDAYPASVVGTDPYSDLAVLNTTAPLSEMHPLQIVASANLQVGEPVVAIGNPFGLSGSMTFGIISQVGRTIAETPAGDFPIADVIQFSAPINPGNSGGPLLTANGTVVGITTATVESSQGVGFAIPSDTILRELPSLITTGSYDMHPYLGVETVDMTYQLAKLEGTNVTYGALIESVAAGGPADQAGLLGGNRTATVQGEEYNVGGDIVVSINGTKVVNTDALSTYLQENCLPGQLVNVGIIRDGRLIMVKLVLGTRPPPSS